MRNNPIFKYENKMEKTLIILIVFTKYFRTFAVNYN